MSTASASSQPTPMLGGYAHFLIRRLHSLTGIMFGGYLMIHLLINATIAQGNGVYQAQVDKIHGLPFLILIEWTFIFMPILFHLFYGLWMTLTCQPNVVNYPFAKNWFYLVQRISAVILVLFIAFHVLALKYGLLGDSLAFEPHGGAMRTIARHMHASPMIAWIIYPVGILASCVHVANGFWTAAITWGLTVSAAAQKRWGAICILIFIVAFAAGMISLVAATRLNSVVCPVGH